MTPLLAMFSFCDGMSSGNEPPPVVENRYGPALTPAERIRWFVDYRTPIEKRRKKIEEPDETEDLAGELELIARAKERVAVEMKRLESEKAEREELEFIMKLLNEDD